MNKRPRPTSTSTASSSPPKRGHVASTLLQDALEYKDDQIPNFAWSESQLQVIKFITEGKNIFFTGCAGTGKSTLLKFLKKTLPSRTTYMTAATGIAACHFGGITLHSFVGAGLAKGNVRQCVYRMKETAILRWKTARLLFVDECSMVSGAFVEKVNFIGQQIRQNAKPFGGIQVVFCGDFLQLPPVTRKTEGFAFQAPSWKNFIDVSYRLNKNFRQKGNVFLTLLNGVREGKIDANGIAVLKKRISNRPVAGDIVETQLFALKREAQAKNAIKLNQLDEKTEHIFNAKDWYKSRKKNDVLRLRKVMNQNQSYETLRLRVGAHVMLVWNLDLDAGLCNGSQGVVMDFREDADHEVLPWVKFNNGEERLIQKLEHKVEQEGKTVSKRKQVPLILAWAITIHKSQGMTIDYSHISLNSSFEYGMAYVALSRLSSLAGLRLSSFDPSCILTHPEALAFDRSVTSN